MQMPRCGCALSICTPMLTHVNAQAGWPRCPGCKTPLNPKPLSPLHQPQSQHAVTRGDAAGHSGGAERHPWDTDQDPSHLHQPSPPIPDTGEWSLNPFDLESPQRRWAPGVWGEPGAETGPPTNADGVRESTNPFE